MPGSLSGSPVTVNPGSTTTFTVTGTDVNGCMNTATATVTVNLPPNVTANSTSSAVCAGNSVTLTGSGATSYSWTGGVTDGVPFVPTSSNTYTITGTDANGCMNTATTSVTVNALPTVDLGADVTQCGGSVMLDAGNAGSSYLWNDASTGQTLTAGTSGTYFVDVTDPNGCMSSDTAVVTINALPTVYIGTDITQCGGIVSLYAGNIGSTYLWSDGSTNQTAVITTSGTYYVDVTDTNGCSGSDTAVITINPIPNVTGSATVNTMCADDASVTLTGSPSGGTWSGPGVTGSSFDPGTAGAGTTILSYSYTDVNGCFDTANVIMTVNACTGIHESVGGDINIYPNPNSGTFTINVTNGNAIGQLMVFDAEGRNIYDAHVDQQRSSNEIEVDLGNVPNGIYLLKVRTDKGETSRLISIQ
jgi:hypothetical protein